MNCPYVKQCGFCKVKQDYQQQAKQKLAHVQDLLAPFGKVDEILTMDDPFFYRNKLTATFSRGKDKKLCAGHYEEGSRNVIPTELCYLENEQAQALVKDIVRLANSFKFTYYDPRTGQGLLRHIQVRTAESTGQIMVTLVTGGPIFPSRNNFVKALRKEHPEITTLIQNINPEPGSMVLGKRSQTLYGPGYIEDKLLGLTFRLSPAAFYQVNSGMTEKLYRTAIDFARITRTDDVIDAYCGTGTIGLSCADFSKSVIGCELNPDAVRDAIANAKRNNIENVTFLCEDAGDFLQDMALEGAHADVVLMDPPRSGSSESFLAACIRLQPSRIVYVSCDPETLARDLEHLTLGGYKMTKAKCVDMFPHTEHCETVCLLVLRNPVTHVNIDVDVEELVQDKRGQATYEQLRDYVKEQTGLHVTNLNIAQIKRKCGIIERENYNLPKTEDSKQPNCTKEKEDAIKEAFKHFGMI